MVIKRGDMFYADLSPVVGSEQGGVRPVLIIQNDTGNKYSPTVIAAAITSQTGKTKLPTHIELNKDIVQIKDDLNIKPSEYGIYINKSNLFKELNELIKVLKM